MNLLECLKRNPHVVYALTGMSLIWSYTNGVMQDLVSGIIVFLINCEHMVLVYSSTTGKAIQMFGHNNFYT